MPDADILTNLLRAWREDIESVPFPTFAELLIPTQQQRTVGGRSGAAPRQVTRTTAWRDR
jgi:hypothetical protein